MVKKLSWRTMILGRSHHQLPGGLPGKPTLWGQVHLPWKWKKAWRARLLRPTSLLFVVFDWSLGEKNIMRNLKELTSGFWNDWISGGSDSEDDTVDCAEIRLTSWYDKCPFLFFKYGFIHPKKVFVWDFWIINRQDFLYRSIQFRMRNSLVGSEKFRPRRSQKLSRGYLLIS